MTYDARLTLLSTHADRLNEGEEQANYFVRRHAPLGPDMIALLELARRLKQVLAPVPVPRDFRAQLHHDLIAHSEKTNSQGSRRLRRPLWFSLVAAGSVLPLLGIFVWRRRRRSNTLLGTS